MSGNNFRILEIRRNYRYIDAVWQIYRYKTSITGFSGLQNCMYVGGIQISWSLEKPEGY